MNDDRLKAAIADRYRIERELGQGGMATVYLAHDLKHDRKVALKVLKPDLAASLGHERFLKEITTTANLRHPHILPLYDSGETDGMVYYVMPFVDGETLRQRIDRERQLPLADVRRIAREVADALSYAHGQGVIHRDIKPENILLEGDHAIVADFGIARAVSAAGATGATALTQTGTAIGTPAYMSPEQAAGEQNLDGRSDLYALGCVTYEMLTGQPPFMGPTAASIVHKHLAATPPSVAQLRTAVPAGLDRALQRALAKNPSDRFVTPLAFAAALDADGRQRRTGLSLRIGIGAVIALVIAGTAWLARRARTSDPTLDTAVIAVLPFRVGGGDQSIAYLRESMLDLLQARLSSSTGPRIVEPRTMLAAWRRAVRDEHDDLSEDGSRALARSVGASRVLLGSAVATPTELTLSGTLIRVADGSVLARESAAGAPDSVAVLVNRLTAALLIREAGESGDRRSGLSAAPLDALQNYLAGRKAARRGDFFGAMDLFSRAFARDSTFVDAAFAMLSTNTWIGTVFNVDGYRVIPFVARDRDRLSPRDRDLFLALPMIGPNFPRASSYAEIIAQAQRGASNAPDSPEHWLLLGQLLSHYGAAASILDWPKRSADALDRAVSLDSSFAPAVADRLFTAMLAGDRTATARFAKLLEARVASGFFDDMPVWAASRALGDTASAIRWRDRTARLSRTDYFQKLTKVSLHSAAFGLPLDDARSSVRRLADSVTTDQERTGAGLAALAVRFAEGGDTPARADIDIVGGPGWAATLIQQGLIESAYRGLATSTIAREQAGDYRLAGGATQLPREVPPDGRITGVVGDGHQTTRWPPTQLCFGELYRVTGNDTVTTRESIRKLRAFAALDPPPPGVNEWQSLDFGLCPLLLEVLLERAPPRGERWTHLDELDSVMRAGPRSLTGALVSPTAFANLTIARLREAQGDLPGALAAIRRREVDYFPMYLWSLAAFLRQEGRLAALIGDVPGALRAYDEYLAMRTNPSASLRPQRDSVLRERAAIVARSK